MIYRKYPLSELHPIRPVVEDEWRLTDIERSVRVFGFFVPLIITSDKKIIDGNKRWYALFKKYGYTWRVATVSCDIPEEKIWSAHIVINASRIVSIDPAEQLLKVTSETMRWRILSQLQFSVPVEPQEKK